MNKRLNRLNLAKRFLRLNPNASAEEIIQFVRAQEKRHRPETFKTMGELLQGFAQK